MLCVIPSCWIWARFSVLPVMNRIWKKLEASFLRLVQKTITFGLPPLAFVPSLCYTHWWSRLSKGEGLWQGNEHGPWPTAYEEVRTSVCGSGNNYILSINTGMNAEVNSSGSSPEIRQGIEKREYFYTCWWKCILVQPLCITIWRFLKKLKRPFWEAWN